MHWLLDVEFGDDMSRYRTCHGAENMAVIRPLDLIRNHKSRGSIKTRRKRARWSRISYSSSYKSPVNLNAFTVAGEWLNAALCAAQLRTIETLRSRKLCRRHSLQRIGRCVVGLEEEPAQDLKGD